MDSSSDRVAEVQNLQAQITALRLENAHLRAQLRETTDRTVTLCSTCGARNHHASTMTAAQFALVGAMSE